MEASTASIGRGMAIDVDEAELPRLLGRCTPDDELQESLDALLDEGVYESQYDSDPVDTGNTVNGVPWGWFHVEDEEGEDAWRLLPLSFQRDAALVACHSAWQTMSMTGAVLSAEGYATATVAVTYSRGDEGYRWLDVRYEFDRGELAVEICRSLSDGDDAMCPDESEHGWEVSLELPPDLPVEVIGRCLDAVWRPCGDEPSHEHLMFDGRPWAWVGGRWHLQSRPPGLQLIALTAWDDQDDVDFSGDVLL